MARRTPVVLLAVVAAGTGAWWYWQTRTPAAVAWQGYVDADYVKVAPTQQGLLTAVYVARGDEVTVGTPLFTQDETDDLAARDQAARQLEQADEQLANLQAGGKQTEIRQAEANLADSRSTLVRAQTDLKRGEQLLPSGAMAPQDVDQLRAAYLSAVAKVQACEAALAQMVAPMGRERQIKAQRAAVEAAKAALKMAEWRLSQRRVSAPVGGRVADVLARPGETMAAGGPVVSLLSPRNILVRFFVPETALSAIHKGDVLALACDGYPGGLRATVSFVSPQAEYTPPVIYSEASRAKLVYLVEARPDPEQATLLNPGQPVTVRPAGAER
jgi:HlyD family secretion protein